MNSQIDDKIRQALSGEDAELYEQFAVEPSLLELAVDALKSQNRWVSAIAIITGMVFMALGILWNFKKM